MAFSLQEASEVRLEIFDSRGRKVKTLVSDRFAAGEFSVIWDGTDANHSPLPSGLYLYQLTTDKGSELKKCVLLK